MDNFEYSIQISDRDWEEFYSTAEECDLIQVSLATEEELLLSDAEQEDAACSTVTSKPKFIRVSLCPPVRDHREPQITPTALSPPKHSAYTWIGPSDDLLSGSEDEEEFGSVARFLCQKETLLSKKVEAERRTNIPSPKTKDDYVANVTTDKSQDSPDNESLVECVSSLNTRRKNHHERDREDVQVKGIESMSPLVTANGESEREQPNGRHNTSVTTNDPSRTNAQLLYSKDPPDISKDSQSCIVVKGSSLPECLLNGNIPAVINSIEDPKSCHLQSMSTLQTSLGKHDQLTPDHEICDSINTSLTLHSLDSPVSTNSNVMEYDTQDCILPLASKVHGDSSAVKQNISAPLFENLDLSKTLSNMQETDTKVSSHELSSDQYRLPRVEGKNPVYSLVLAPNSGHAMPSRSLPTPCPSPSYRNTALTLPEMYDLFFDDASESGVVGNETNMAGQEAIFNVHTVSNRSLPTELQPPLDRSKSLTLPEMYDLFFDDVSQSGIVGNGTNMAGQEATISGHTVSNRSLPTQHQPPLNRSKGLTLPEMYDLFFDDVSESGTVETGANMAGQETVFSGHTLSNRSLPTQHQSLLRRSKGLTLPEMYDLFFDDISESEVVGNGKNMAGQEATFSGLTMSNRRLSTQLQPPLDRGKGLTLPEMYDLFFDDVSQSGIVETGKHIGSQEATFSGHTTSNWRPPTQLQFPLHRNTDLTLPEMYDFFFDDVSDSGICESGTKMASQDATQEAIVYTPEMYEYFFLEDENTIKGKDRKPEEPSAKVEQDPAPSVVASWPEACEFFFADGPQNQDKEGIVVSIPSSQAQRATSIIRSIVPQRLREFTVRRTIDGRDGKLIPHVNLGASEETNVPTTGSLVPYLSPSRSDACLVFLALASWAVKSSDLQSSDGWKTALLANIGAVSAIGYVRRRRRTWQGPSLEPVEEN
ncbi:PGC-1 and ERR-induced regulator in muscle protein 1 [Mantella aurantiaca]